MRAAFERYGTKRGWKGRTEETILFRNIVRADTGEVLADHLWLNKTVGFQKLGELKAGDLVEFEARVKQLDAAAGAGFFSVEVPRRRRHPLA